LLLITRVATLAERWGVRVEPGDLDPMVVLTSVATPVRRRSPSGESVRQDSEPLGEPLAKLPLLRGNEFDLIMLLVSPMLPVGERVRGVRAPGGPGDAGCCDECGGEGTACVSCKQMLSSPMASLCVAPVFEPGGGALLGNALPVPDPVRWWRSVAWQCTPCA